MPRGRDGRWHNGGRCGDAVGYCHAFTHTDCSSRGRMARPCPACPPVACARRTGLGVQFSSEHRGAHIAIVERVAALTGLAVGAAENMARCVSSKLQALHPPLAPPWGPQGKWWARQFDARCPCSGAPGRMPDRECVSSCCLPNTCSAMKTHHHRGWLLSAPAAGASWRMLPQSIFWNRRLCMTQTVGKQDHPPN